MALGTNYRRNLSAEDKAIASRQEQAKALAAEFIKEYGTDPMVALGFASAVVLKRMTVEHVTARLREIKEGT